MELHRREETVSWVLNAEVATMHKPSTSKSPDRRGAVLLAVLTAGALGLSPRTEAAVTLKRGDADLSGALTISDAISVLNFLFSGGKPPPCTAVANANGDANLNITDPVFLLGFLFLGSEAPPPLTENETLVCRGFDPAAVARGMEVYQSPDPDLFADLFSCSVCHVVSPDADTD